MKAKTIVVLLLLTASIAVLHPKAVNVKAASGGPTFLVLLADAVGWNSSCAPSPGCPKTNPGYAESVGNTFKVNIQFDDLCCLIPNHDIGIYTNGTTAGVVSISNTCSISNTVGCLAKAGPIDYTVTPSANLTFTVPPSGATGNLGGSGGFEYFCQYHPSSMHGHITISKSFVFLANFTGWNSTSTKNPGFKEFTGVKFRVNVQFSDINGETHDFAIYTNATTAGSVSILDSCSTSNTIGCLANSVPVSAGSPSANLDFTALLSGLPPSFGGLGGFEYFCQYHPSSMHGHITVYKDPDIAGPSGTPNHLVDIFDIAAIAFAYGSIPGKPNWNVATDLDNNGIISILDVAQAAFYYGQTF